MSSATSSKSTSTRALAAESTKVLNVLSALDFVDSTHPAAAPTANRRTKLIIRIKDQINCASAQMEGNSFISPTTDKTIKHWYWSDEDGSIRCELRYGSKPLPLDPKGKNHAFRVADLKQLIVTLEQLSEAVNRGDLDAALATVAKSLSSERKV